jgi:hypothetical protein
MTGGRDDDGGVDGVRVHAGLIIVVHGYEGPVGDDAGDAEGPVGVLTRDEVFNCGGVEEFDVGEGEDFGE